MASYNDEFFHSYLETALWSSMGDDGRPLDDEYSVDDISPEAMAAMRADCDAFIESNWDILDKYPADLCGHDFWLTRNRHGAGFWDGDYEPEDGRKLTECSHGYGDCYLYVGDDGLIYC